MISVWIVVLLAQAVSAAPASASARVTGRVVNSLNGDPVTKAVVILRAHDPEHGLSYADETDAQGRFSIPDVEPGEYAIAVDRAGFVLESTGATGATAPSVKVDAAQRVQNFAIRLTPLGAISGRILDVEGDAARGARVDALHYEYKGGRKQLRTVVEVEAGDRGDFRLFGLRPGTYYMKATGLQVAPFESIDKGTVTYYPGIADSSRAVPIDLRAGAQMSGFDIRLQSSGAYKVRFELPPGIGLSPVGSQLLNSQGFVPTEGWSFRSEIGFGNVPPGSYEAIFTGLQADKSPGFARRHVEVINADVDGGTIEFVPGAAITGTVRVEGGTIPSLASLSIHLQSDYRDLPQFNPSTGVHADGSFAFEGTVPLTYSLSIDSTAGVYLKSVRVGDRPLAQPRIDAAEKLDPLTVVLGADTGQLAGAVENSKGDPVARARVDAIAADRPDWNRSAFSDEKGQFSITGLPPGQYKIFAWENVPDGAPQDPEFRKPFDKQALSVSIQSKAHGSLKITAISAAQVDRSLQ
jgi:hypothetical protein